MCVIPNTKVLFTHSGVSQIAFSDFQRWCRKLINLYNKFHPGALGYCPKACSMHVGESNMTKQIKELKYYYANFIVSLRVQT